MLRTNIISSHSLLFISVECDFGLWPLMGLSCSSADVMRIMCDVYFSRSLFATIWPDFLCIFKLLSMYTKCRCLLKFSISILKYIHCGFIHFRFQIVINIRLINIVVACIGDLIDGMFRLIYRFVFLLLWFVLRLAIFFLDLWFKHLLHFILRLKSRLKCICTASI